jgi:solute carrier family 25 carnitine/acylcarnitine transporter 20/29
MNIPDFVCGLFAGWTQVMIGQPFDFVKVKIQTSTSKTHSIPQITKDIYQQYGLKGFYRGSSSLLFGFAFIIGT